MFTFDLNLQWLSFNVDLNTVYAWMQANAGSNFCGISANFQCVIHFTADPGSTVDSAIQAYWSGLSNSSPEATNYMSASARSSAAASAKATNLASAQSKLEALGLTADEIAAITGQ